MSKCEIAGSSVKKGVYVALCGMKCVNLTSRNYKNTWCSFLPTKKSFRMT